MKNDTRCVNIIIIMKITKKILPTGLRLVTIPIPENPSVTVLVMVAAGSKYETKDISGISHFLEHMVFKGTPRRPSASDISRELDAIGAQYNAFTSQEFTGYYAKADAKHLDRVLDVVADMCQNPLFEESEIAKERGVIIEELRMYRDLPQHRVHNVLNSLLYGDQPAGWEVIGTEETIKSFTRQSFLDYRSQHYVASATTVVVAGNFDEKSLKEDVEQAFGQISTATKSPKLAVVENQTSPAVRVEAKDTDQTHLVLAVRTFPIFDPRVPTMQVLSAILGGGMSSRLFSKMRDELGICYYIRAAHDPATDHGTLTIAAGVDNSRVVEGLRGILGECRRLKDELVPAAELQKAKDYLSGTTMLELETSDAQAEFVGLQEILKNQIESPQDLIAKISKVTAADIQALAREVFVDSGLNLALIGRSKESDLQPILTFQG